MTYLQPAMASRKLPGTVRSAANSFRRSAACGRAVRCPTALRLHGSLQVACTVYPRSSSCCTTWPVQEIKEDPLVDKLSFGMMLCAECQQTAAWATASWSTTADPQARRGNKQRSDS
jgi:hypothetical protein